MEARRINVPGVNEKWRAGLIVVFRVDASLQMGIDHVKSIRPGFGLSPKFYDYVVGKTAKLDTVRGIHVTRDV